MRLIDELIENGQLIFGCHPCSYASKRGFRIECHIVVFHPLFVLSFLTGERVLEHATCRRDGLASFDRVRDPPCLSFELLADEPACLPERVHVHAGFKPIRLIVADIPVVAPHGTGMLSPVRWHIIEPTLIVRYASRGVFGGVCEPCFGCIINGTDVLSLCSGGDVLMIADGQPVVDHHELRDIRR